MGKLLGRFGKLWLHLNDGLVMTRGRGDAETRRLGLNGLNAFSLETSLIELLSLWEQNPCMTL
ncbi:MAG: hypothetical protein F6K47_35685 [Symploca sp. SIO2E6]|nr:hypothetical protein [Symploca sp. SIO2E6]